MSDKRHEARYQRRKAKREAKRKEKIGNCDNFGNVANADNLVSAFKNAKKGVSWKESIQRYEANLLTNILETKQKLLNGEDIRRGFVEFDVNERGKVRHIKSVHISERVVQKCLCNEVLTPIFTRSLIYDNGASIKNKGISFALNRLICHLRRFPEKTDFLTTAMRLSSTSKAILTTSTTAHLHCRFRRICTTSVFVAFCGTLSRLLAKRA